MATAPRKPPHKPLTDAQLRTLLAAKYDDRKRLFPNHPRRFLDAEYARAREMFPPQQLLAIDADRLRDQSRIRELDSLYKAAQQQLDEMRAQLHEARGFPDVRPREISIPSPKGPEAREATAIAIASDWHCEERVTKEATNGLNEFNLEIFKERSRWFFVNLRKLVLKERQTIAIKRLLLAIIGDMITGNIHPDLAESNLLGPMDAIALVQDTLAGGIRYLLEETDLDLVIVIKPGNHSRITVKQRVQTEHANSLEWYMGHNLAKLFAGEKRVRFVCDRSLLTYVEIYGRPIRFTHGHAFKYGGGVGGITIPVNKKIAEWDKGRQAYLTMFGHLHTYMSGQRFISNGSLIGYATFSEWIGAAYEDPVQAFTLIDSKFGRTVEAPILLEEA